MIDNLIIQMIFSNNVFFFFIKYFSNKRNVQKSKQQIELKKNPQKYIFQPQILLKISTKRQPLMRPAMTG